MLDSPQACSSPGVLVAGWLGLAAAVAVAGCATRGPATRMPGGSSATFAERWAGLRPAEEELATLLRQGQVDPSFPSHEVRRRSAVAAAAHARRLAELMPPPELRRCHALGVSAARALVTQLRQLPVVPSHQLDPARPMVDVVRPSQDHIETLDRLFRILLVVGAARRACEIPDRAGMASEPSEIPYVFVSPQEPRAPWATIAPGADEGLRRSWRTALIVELLAVQLVRGTREHPPGVRLAAVASSVETAVRELDAMQTGIEFRVCQRRAVDAGRRIAQTLRQLEALLPANHEHGPGWPGPGAPPGVYASLQDLARAIRDLEDARLVCGVSIDRTALIDDARRLDQDQHPEVGGARRQAPHTPRRRPGRVSSCRLR